MIGNKIKEVDINKKRINNINNRLIYKVNPQSVKSNILLYKNSILFDIDRRYKVDKFNGKFELLSKKVVYSIDYEEVMGEFEEVNLN